MARDLGGELGLRSVLLRPLSPAAFGTVKNRLPNVLALPSRPVGERPTTGQAKLCLFLSLH